MTKKIITMSLLMLSLSAFAQKDTVKVKEVGLVFSNLNSFGLCYKFGNENTLFRITALSLTGTNTNDNYSDFTEGGNTDAVPANSTKTIGVGLNLGFEKRSRISDRFYFYYGAALINSYTNNTNNTTTPTTYTDGYFIHSNYFGQAVIVNNTIQTNAWTISSGFGIIIGVACKLNRSFSIGAELIPSATYSYNEAKATANTYYVSSWTVVPNAPSTPNIYNLTGNSDKITKGISYSIINTNAAITIAYRIK